MVPFPPLPLPDSQGFDDKLINFTKDPVLQTWFFERLYVIHDPKLCAGLMSCLFDAFFFGIRIASDIILFIIPEVGKFFGLLSEDGCHGFFNNLAFYFFGSVNLYLPLPRPMIGSISPASFSLFIRLPAAVIEMFTRPIISLRPNTPSKLM